MKSSEANVEYSEIAFMPNQSNLDDMSFNYETNKGVKNYNSYFNRHSRVYRPESMNPTSIEYRKTFNNISKNNCGILTNGFMPLDALIGEMNYDTGWRNMNGWLLENNENYGILLDNAGLEGEIEISSNGVNFQKVNIDNGISITYKANEAGFFAGIAAALYSTFAGNSKHKVSTFGGLQFENVYDWMSGFEQGINWFNWAILGYDIVGNKNLSNTNQDDITVITDINELDGVEINSTNKKKTLNLKSRANNNFSFEKIELVTPKDVDKKIDYEKNIFENGLDDSSVKWFTGSFDPGDGEEVAGIINNKIDVVFPVAGVQTSDILAYNSNTVKVIGVDSDISKVYTSPSMKNNILGSATKNLSYGATFSMWYAERWTNEFKINDITGELQSDSDAYKKILEKGNDMDQAMYKYHIEGREYDENGKIITNSISDKSWLTEQDSLNKHTQNQNNNNVIHFENNNDLFEHDYFIVNYENNGVSFTSEGAEKEIIINDNSEKKVIKIPLLDSLIMEMNNFLDVETTWSQFMNIAYNSQKDDNGELFIEYHSPTFTYDEDINEWSGSSNHQINSNKNESYWTIPIEFYS